MLLNKPSSKTMSPRIAIIGAGIAGISAASTLFKNGLNNFVVFEADKQIGGRIRSIIVDGKHVELGAQWIHGQKDNILYELAAKRNLLMDAGLERGYEGTGQFAAEDGTLVDQSLVQELINYLDAKKEVMSEDEGKNQNVFTYFRNKFDQFVDNKKSLVDKDHNLLKWTFRWFVLFEMIDNSCDKLSDLSILSYTEWKDYDGLDLVNLREGYQSIINELLAEFNFREHLCLSTAVKRLEVFTEESFEKKFKVKLYTKKVDKVYTDEETEEELAFEVFDNVIITSSIGFLKHALFTNFFGFTLPSSKQTVIESLGFGNINKMFFYFDKPFWQRDTFKGLQLLWQNVNNEQCYEDPEFTTRTTKFQQNFAAWAYFIQGFDPVLQQPNMLMAWIGGDGAKMIELESKIDLCQECQHILQTFLPAHKNKIDCPRNVYFERWSSHVYIRGAYSHRPMSYQQLGKLSPEVEYNVDILTEPIRASDIFDEGNTNANQYNLTTPLVLFAGEATDREHFSTTDGAFRSGVREANRLVVHYKN